MLPRIIFLLSLIFLLQCTSKTTEIPTKKIYEFQTRYKMTYDRLTTNVFHPVFSESFILADVNINPENPRRFSEFSGDLSGRYIEAMSIAAKDKDLEFLHKIVAKTLTYQKSDGRFGNPELNFRQNEITGEHMALLWGNGRMLVGLLEYYNRFQDSNVLNAAIKLGDFYLTVYDACATPETIQKLEGFGAQGIICFTQYIEGMVRLAEITGRKNYLDVCMNVYPLLPERKKQHSHGFLTTLRGVLLMNEYTRDLKQLEYVIKQYDDLINSSDFTIYGSVAEYFGGKGMRDEGCASSDFVRLGLELFRITGDHKYLETAEFAMFNAFYFNQYKTGDFGHHILSSNLLAYTHNPGKVKINYNGAAPSYPMAAWWCCTMHGMRCFSYLNDQMINILGDSAFLNLYIEADFKDDEFIITSSRLKSEKFTMLFQLDIENNDNKTIYLRKPTWAAEIEIFLNNQNVEFSIVNNYIKVNENINSQDILQVGFNFSPNVSERFNRDADRNKGISSRLTYGPFLMGIDDNTDPAFTAEPNNNKISLGSIQPIMSSEKINGYDKSFYLEAEYHHSGFPSNLKTVFRPVKNLTFEKRPALFLEFDFIKK